jgi:diphthamide biosynthesis protein 7
VDDLQEFYTHKIVLSSTSTNDVVASFSDGSIAVWNSDDINAKQRWRAHSQEAWIAAFDCWHSDIVYSGADDARLCCWDVRTACDTPQSVSRYDVGVTTVQSHAHREHCLAVGSYDETVRIWDTRLMRTAVCRNADLVAACMHGKEGVRMLCACCLLLCKGGFVSLLVDHAAGSICVRNQWSSPHTSLAYGISWRAHTHDDTKRDLIACCSFYDSLLSLWLL